MIDFLKKKWDQDAFLAFLYGIIFDITPNSINFYFFLIFILDFIFFNIQIVFK